MSDLDERHSHFKKSISKIVVTSMSFNGKREVLTKIVKWGGSKYEGRCLGNREEIELLWYDVN